MGGGMRLVFGLGKSGLGVLRFLARRGMAAEFYDDRPRPEDVAAARSLGFAPAGELVPGRYQEVIAAPGVPLDHPLLKKLGAPVIGEAELAYRLGQAEIIGVTGTAGKSSTTTLIAELLRAAGLDAEAGGNLGTPLVEVVDRARVAVAELSSFQLERVERFHPRVAVLLNLGRDHLDRHGSLEAYHAAKLRLLKNLGPKDALVYNRADPRVQRAAEASAAKKYPFDPADDPRATNRQAALAAAQAYLALTGRRADPDRLRAVAEAAPALPGRFEVVGRRGELVFIDDSIATRTLAVAAALKTAPAPIAWILGGVDKGADPEALRPLVAERVALILAIGRDGPRLARAFSDLVPVEVVAGDDGLREAVRRAARKMTRGSVLLAPLAASFDQFQDYKERSRVFREAVREVLWTPSSS